MRAATALPASPPRSIVQRSDVRLMRVAVGAVLVAVVAATAVAFAAGAGLASGPVAAGSTVVARCDTGTITPTYVGAPSTVTAVTISGLSSACNGGSLRL